MSTSTPRFLQMRSFQVSIKVDGQKLPIHRVKYDRKNHRAVGWIASTERNFSVVMKQAYSFAYTTAADLLMDGVKVCDTVFGEGYEFRDELSSIAILSTASRPFEFKPLKTLDDEALRERNPGFTAPGTRIEVRMNRVRIVEDGRENNWEDYATQVPERELTVHEADYKAGTHIMHLGEEVPSDNVRIFTFPLETSDEEPWVTFEFRYRPIAMLQAEGIIPKPAVEVIDLTAESD